MGEIIRVLVHDSEKDSNSLACLERPLVFDAVVMEMNQLLAENRVLSSYQIENSKIYVYPNGDCSKKPVLVRSNALDRSIRDGDLIALVLPVDENSDTTTSGKVLEMPPNLSEETQQKIEKLLGWGKTESKSKKNKRGRSLSSKFWLANKLAAAGHITKEQKDNLKHLLISGDDYLLNQAFESYEQSGDLTELLNISVKVGKPLNFTSNSDNDSNLIDSMKSDLNFMTTNLDDTLLPDLPNDGLNCISTDDFDITSSDLSIINDFCSNTDVKNSEGPSVETIEALDALLETDF